MVGWTRCIGLELFLLHFFRLGVVVFYTARFEFACEIFCYEKTVIIFTGLNLLGGETRFDVDVFLAYSIQAMASQERWSVL
jgi:hypothetical protein